ncbi:MAG: hypothetical protein DI623_08275 [Sphingomonas sanxanigenens]|uniref:Nucleotidyltransferase family protein n=1 Tax=Sphingomonas sanxanigenens TaxID=397260 RepID=A0A2W5ACB7_9SPHN|nr:MAG: hypothetical protein DI623_08275 [Sphingomonas sanxanigenens]
MTSPYRPEFEAALRIFARVSGAMKARGFAPPVLVGGAAVELYSASAVVTGDFDVVTGRQDAFEEELCKVGFVRPGGAGKATRGWIHPDLGLGFEVVSDSLLDGMADRDRLRFFSLDADGEAAVLSLEDMIADRVGQYASGSAPAMLGQARTLFDLFPDADLEYLERRIRHESGGDHGLEILNA